MSRKFTYRPYRKEAPGVRRRERKHVAVPRTSMAAPSEPKARWSIDFVSDALADWRKRRAVWRRPW